MKFKYVVVGAGLAGITVAERIATQLHEEVLVIEKRDHCVGASRSTSSPPDYFPVGRQAQGMAFSYFSKKKIRNSALYVKTPNF